MNNKIIELKQKDIDNVGGGTNLAAGLAMRFGLSATYTLYKTWINGGCDANGKYRLCEKFMCYTMNAVEDGLFFGVGLTLFNRYLPIDDVKTKIA